MPGVVRFGEFQVDLRAGELCRNGQLLRIQELHFRILAFLLERPGEVITRQELRDRLWPPDVFLDFDHSINKGISRLRSLLNDSADTPRFIETVGKRGYRFAAPVEAAPPAADGAGADAPSLTREARRSRWLSRLRPWAVVAAMAGLLAFAAVARLPKETQGPLLSRPFTSNPGFENMPAFSPDGQTLAFVWSGSGMPEKDGIWLQRVESDEARQLTHSNADLTPAWSPDGERLAIVRRLGGERFAIYLIASSGGGERKLAEITAWTTSLVAVDWSPDGRSLATTDGGESGAMIVLISVEGGEKRRVTPPDPSIPGDTRPKFSPDGRMIAFRRTRNSSVEDIYLAPNMAASGSPQAGAVRRLTFDNRGIQGLAWAADSQSLIFSSQRLGNLPSLWRIPVSGGEPIQLTETGISAVLPAISQRTNRLAYVRQFTDVNIWRRETSGDGPAQPLIASSTLLDSGPQYSPDGFQIAFRSARSGSDEVWICDAGGNRQRRLTNFNGPLTGSPRWSPDGSWLAFESRQYGHADIYLMRPDGSGMKRLTTEMSNESVPSWSADGRWIYFASDRTAKWQVWKQAPAGGAALQVTSNGGFAAFESRDGQFLYYSKVAPQSGLWRLNPSGERTRQEELVIQDLEAEMWGNWAINGSGIWFLRYPRDTRPRVAEISFYDPTTKSRREIARMERTPARWDSGLAVSMDSKWILFAQVDQAGSDIMLVEHFR